MKLSLAAQIMKGVLKGKDDEFVGVSIDSRTIQKNNLFFAFPGSVIDGHQFVDQVKLAGAKAAVVSQPVVTDLTTIQVKDTHQALIQLASCYRDQLKLEVIAVTGSCGKTTTRSLLENIFQLQAPTVASEKSYNNNLGVPLTLLRVKAEHRYLISELGANHLGEILELTQMVKPDVAIITNAAPAHLEGFGSIDGVAKEKGQIYSGLGDQGVAIINADDHYADYWKKSVGAKKIVTFGIEKKADVTAENIQFNAATQPSFLLKTPDGSIPINLKILGLHNVMNALAAAAAAVAKKIPLKLIKQGLEQNTAVNKRLCEVNGFAGAKIIDDSYNANPLSVRAAMDVLSKKKGTKILVFGDMGELGSKTSDFHQEIGKEAALKGIHKLYAFGDLSRNTVQAFGHNAFHFAHKDDLVKMLKKDLAEDVTVLVKGSRSMRMEQVVEALVKD